MRELTLKPIAVFASVLSIFSLCGCKGTDKKDAAPQPVTISHPLEESVIDWDDYPSRLESPQFVNITPRVSGEVVDAPYDEGAIVQKGAILFVIDDRPYKAELDSREGAASRAMASATLGDINLKRLENVKDSKAISAAELDTARATLQQTRADLASARAAADIARLNLEWTKVTAPVAGRAGRKLVTVGNLAAAAQGVGTTLTTITSIDPMYAYVNVPERVYLRYRDMIGNSDNSLPLCSIKLENGKEFGNKGKIDFVDNKVDPQTGTVQMRCAIPNPQGTLTAGLFCRLRLPGSDYKKTILVPDRSIGTEQNGRFVFVVGANNQIETRPVKLGSLFGKLRGIDDGVTPGDLVVTNGMQGLKAGSAVVPKEEAIGEDLIPAESRSNSSSDQSSNKAS